MAKKVKKKSIDKELFSKAMKKRGIVIQRISEELGYDSAYIQHYIVKRELPEPVVNYLEKGYGVKYEEYALKQIPEENTVEKSNEETIARIVARSMGTFAVKDELGRAVRFALLDEHTQDMFKKMIKEACEEAVEEVLNK